MSKKFLKPGTIVEIAWHDAAGQTAGWMDLEEVLNDLNVMSVTTVGYVIRHDKKQLILVHSMSEDAQVIAPMAIPSPWLRKIKVLSKP